MKITEITDLNSEEFKIYTSLTDHTLRYQHDIFIAESPKVIKVALEEGYEPVSLLCERKHIKGDASDIILKNPEMPIYTGDRELLAKLTGYTLTRGVLCAMKRKPDKDDNEIISSSKLIAVIENICDTTNIGSIFRSATALGIDAILLTPQSCDPFNRRSVRVSMGAVFKIPWKFCNDPIGLLERNSFTTVALTLEKDSIDLDSPQLQNIEKMALVLGSEGHGLSSEIIKKCHYKAIIPMFKEVDSLNVGAAAAIAFWEMTKNKMKNL